MVAAQAASPVLIVGDLGARLELELSAHGVSCTTAPTANDAVARMKATRFPIVVVPPVLADMGGVDFIHGVLRHFDANVVLYGNGIEAAEINALLRTGRVAHFPAQAEGHVVADFLARRQNGATPTPLPSSLPPTKLPTSTPQPSMPQGRQFNLTPGPPVTTPPLTEGMQRQTASIPPTPLSAALFGTGTPGALSSVSTQFAGPPATTPFPSFPPQGAGAFAVQGNVPRPPTMVPVSGPAASSQFERIVDDLARANAELVVVQGKLAAAEQEKAAMAIEVEAARRSAMAQVAQVMALSDEGDPVQEELEELKRELASTKNEYAMARAEADALRDERARLMGDAAEHAQRVVELQSRLDQAEGAVTELALVRGALEEQATAIEKSQNEIESVKIERNAIMKELEVVRGERDVAKHDVDAVRAEMAALANAANDAQNATLEKNALTQKIAAIEQERDAFANQLSVLEKERDDAYATLQRAEAAAQESLDEAQAIATQTQQAAEQRIAMLEAQRTELVTAVSDAQRKAEEAKAGGSDVESALRMELERVRTDVTAARTDATTVRLDLQEALMRLDEQSAAMQSAQEERDALRAEAVPLREWANQVVAAHAEQQAELERMRALVENAAQAQRAIGELQAQLQQEREKRASSSSSSSSGGGAGGDTEVLIARSRQLADLVRALEPFMWGLTQATGFYTKAAVAGGEVHLKLLQQLQGVLLRLRDEIAMLDLG